LGGGGLGCWPVVVGAGVGQQVGDGLGCGVGDGGVDGHLVLAGVVDGLEVEGGEQPFGESFGGVGEDVPEGGQFV
jgi:hypothetical protein